MFDDVVSRGTRSFLFYFSGGDLLEKTSAVVCSRIVVLRNVLDA